MEQSELLRFIVAAVERLGLQYFVTGSTVTIFFGEPRFTNDIDIVVALPPSAVAELCRQFPEDEFYVSEEAATSAVRQHSQFNIIHPKSGLKVDVIVPLDTPFNESRFRRARRVHAGTDWDALFASPEDAILKISSVARRRCTADVAAGSKGTLLRRRRSEAVRSRPATWPDVQCRHTPGRRH